MYRDEKLSITAPSELTGVHGTGYPLLGGVGGAEIETASGYAAQYENALDVAFRDAAIWYLVYDRNPMIGLARNSFGLMQATAGEIFRGVCSPPPGRIRGQCVAQDPDNAAAHAGSPGARDLVIMVLLEGAAATWICATRNGHRPRLPPARWSQCLASSH